MSLKKYNYLDLFSGMGGFHKAAQKIKDKKFVNLGAADIDETTKKYYYQNYKIKVKHGINWFKENDIKCKINIIFAGFPCQPFSHAGKRNGFNHHKGNLFWDLQDIIEKYKPEMILLENVFNLKNHDNGNTWKVIHKELCKNYWIPELPLVFSPEKFGHPELRKRVYIPGFRKSKYNSVDFSKYSIEKVKKIKKLNYFIRSDVEGKKLNSHQKESIFAWDELLKRLNYKIAKPAWGHVWNLKKEKMKYSEGTKIIKKNKDFFKENKKIIEAWKKEYSFDKFLPSYKKLEWNVSGDKYKSCYDGIIQFRPSGIRVKKINTLPTMVALNQTPYIGPSKRFITVEEVAKIQGFGNIKYKDISNNKMFKMLGNNVNVHVTHWIIKRMINE